MHSRGPRSVSFLLAFFTSSTCLSCSKRSGELQQLGRLDCTYSLPRNPLSFILTAGFPWPHCLFYRDKPMSAVQSKLRLCTNGLPAGSLTKLRSSRALKEAMRGRVPFSDYRRDNSREREQERPPSLLLLQLPRQTLLTSVR